jgi:hypothetical protein
MELISEYRQVVKLLQEKQHVVFFAESRHYYQYFEHLINDLLANSDKRICYITADNKDPLLTAPVPGMKIICVKWLGFLFSRIKADVMIMTMPDLDNFLLKRSNGVGCYIYMFHAAVSTHQQYRQKAFFNYDTIFCTGSYQQQEIRAAEKIYQLPEKEIIPYGYPLLDALQQKKSAHPPSATILIAPSWFEGCIFDTCIGELLLQLSGLPYTIILRSHPEYEKRRKKEFKKIKKLVAIHSNLLLDDQPDVAGRLSSASILITDRSGIALEFAFGTGRPVLWIDTVAKQTNPYWKQLEIEPIENSLRRELGISLLPSELSKLPGKIKELEAFSKGFEQKMEALKKTIFYDSAEGSRKGWEYVISKIPKD